MRLIAHRGFASVHPENTLRAIEAAAATADAIEIDVRRCATGELVVFHDETVDRVSDGTGAVAEHTRSELAELDVLDTGDGVPTLVEALESIPEHVGANVELKEPGTEAAALDAIASHHPNAIVSSFSRPILEECRRLDPDVPRAYIVDDSGLDGVEVAIGLECAYLHPSVGCCDDRVVADAHRAGMSVNVWTVDSPREAERLAESGVDGVIADRPDIRPEASP